MRAWDLGRLSSQATFLFWMSVWGEGKGTSEQAEPRCNGDEPLPAPGTMGTGGYQRLRHEYYCACINDGLLMCYHDEMKCILHQDFKQYAQAKDNGAISKL
jgi:hypothetical protein